MSCLPEKSGLTGVECIQNGLCIIHGIKVATAAVLLSATKMPILFLL